jgi:hypothetical protein
MSPVYGSAALIRSGQENGGQAPFSRKKSTYTKDSIAL